MTHDYLLGNAALHARFFATTQILARLVSSAPRAVSIAQLESETGRPARELGKLCLALGRAGVLCQAQGCQDRWRLAGDPCEVTLEDVFRAIAEQQTPPRAGKAPVPAPVANGSDVDLLLMQAMIAINQSVSTQLRRFSLDRVKASSSPPFPVPRRVRQAQQMQQARGFEEAVLQDSSVHLAA